MLLPTPVVLTAPALLKAAELAVKLMLLFDARVKPLPTEISAPLVPIVKAELFILIVPLAAPPVTEKLRA